MTPQPITPHTAGQGEYYPGGNLNRRDNSDIDGVAADMQNRERQRNENKRVSY